MIDEMINDLKIFTALSMNDEDARGFLQQASIYLGSKLGYKVDLTDGEIRRLVLELAAIAAGRYEKGDYAYPYDFLPEHLEERLYKIKNRDKLYTVGDFTNEELEDIADSVLITNDNMLQKPAKDQMDSLMKYTTAEEKRALMGMPVIHTTGMDEEKVEEFKKKIGDPANQNWMIMPSEQKQNFQIIDSKQDVYPGMVVSQTDGKVQAYMDPGMGPPIGIAQEVYKDGVVKANFSPVFAPDDSEPIAIKPYYQPDTKPYFLFKPYPMQAIPHKPEPKPKPKPKTYNHALEKWNRDLRGRHNIQAFIEEHICHCGQPAKIVHNYGDETPRVELQCIACHTEDIARQHTDLFDNDQDFAQWDDNVKNGIGKKPADPPKNFKPKQEPISKIFTRNFEQEKQENKQKRQKEKNKLLRRISVLHNLIKKANKKQKKELKKELKIAKKKLKMLEEDILNPWGPPRGKIKKVQM